jgi:hypothetical protein
MTLRHLQSLFARVVTGCEAADALEEQLRTPARQVRARIELYARAYFARLHDVLREDFPKVAQALGDGFEQRMREYVESHPSEHPSLRHLGRHLPAFLSRQARGDEPPWIPDLARLEWTRVEAFDAADSATIRLEELKRIRPECWPLLRFVPVPSLRVLALSWPVDEIWLTLDAAEGVLPTEPRATTMVVWRSELVVRHRACSVAEGRAIALLAGSQQFASVCEAFSDFDGVEGEAKQAFDALRQWIADGWIACDRGAGSDL